MMRSNQQLAQPGNNFILGINEAPILPANSTHSRLNSIVANEKPESPPAQAVEIPNIKDGR
jgi:hypothetical protein